MASWPDSMQLALLTADFRMWENGDSLEAVVYISSPSALVSQTDDIIVPRLDQYRVETTGGTIAEELPVNNDPQWLPNGDWLYLVQARFSTGRKMAWLVDFAGTGGEDQTYDLADIGVEIPYPGDTGPFTVIYPLPPVTGGGGGSGAVDSVFGRTGAVTAQTGDYATAQITGLTAALGGKVDTTRTISAGTGLSGGGDLSANRTLTVTYGATAGTAAQGNDSRLSDTRVPLPHASSHNDGGADEVLLDPSQVSGLAALLAARVPTTRQVIAGVGLTGGGDLSADRTLTVAYGTSGTTAAVGNDARLGDARTPTAHAASHAAAGGDAVTLTQAQIAGLTAALGNLQPLDGDLTAIAGLAPANDDIVQRKAGAWTNRTVAQLLTDLGLGALYQPLDPDLTAIAGQTATTNNMLMSVASAWASRTPAQVKAALAIAEADVTNLVSDLALKSPIASPTFTGIVTAPRIRTPYVALTPGATVATDANLGQRFEFTAGQNFTLSNPTNLVDGDMLLWKITQDGTGSRIMTLGSLFSFGSLITAAVLSTGINKIDYLGAIYDSSVPKLHVLSFGPGY